LGGSLPEVTAASQRAWHDVAGLSSARLTRYGNFAISDVMARKPARRPQPGDLSSDPPTSTPRLVVWIASSKDDISALHDPVKASFGHRLREVQEGRTPLDTKPLPQFGGGVFELRERFESNAYRLMYVVALKKAIYVLHAVMKKSKTGIGLPKPDVALIELRLKRAQSLDAED
jgi:phage-related protein